MRTISVSISVALGYVAVRLPARASCSWYKLWTLDGASYEIASESDGSDAVVYPAATTIGLLEVHEKLGKLTAGEIICYVKGTSTTTLHGLIVA